MSKVSFRARALDATKPMPVYKADEIPDLPDFAAINRSVPQMPTGMEKEEETEHHLQRALSAQQVYGTAEALVIPIPEVEDTQEHYAILYKEEYKQTKQYVHIQAFGMDQEIPDYDMDSEDERWMNDQVKKMEITPLKFEEMLDRLEKGSGQQVVALPEAKLLLKEDDDLIIAVYDYWLNKRLRTQHALIPTVKTEKRDGSTTNNPYVAFRRRTEKMQTRKNRKNDEVSYEKMLKLRRDLNRATTLLEMIKRREKTKKELLQLTIEVLEKRYQFEDFSGSLLAEAEAQRHKYPPFIPPYQYSRNSEWGQGEPVAVRKKRQYRKQRHKQGAQQQDRGERQPAHFNDIDILHPEGYSSEEEGLSAGLSPSDHEDENDPDGPFAFRRRRNCSYYAPLLNRVGGWPWDGPEENSSSDKKFRYNLASVSQPKKCLGFARRRIGRGGRVIFDRALTPWDDALNRLDLSSGGTYSGILGDYVTYIRERKISHFRPCSPSSEDSLPFGSSNLACTEEVAEFDLESFQSHREQLLQMQREQQEQLLRQEASEVDSSMNGLEHSFSSQPASRFTLDSASAKFAVSAVMNTSELQMQHNTSTSRTACTISSSPVSSLSVISNGPVLENKTPGLSTSPAATVLQLNFPISTCMSALSSSTASSSPVNSVITSSVTPIRSVPNKTVPSVTPSILKLANQKTSIDSIPKQNHEDTNPFNFNTEKMVAMDVT